MQSTISEQLSVRPTFNQTSMEIHDQETKPLPSIKKPKLLAFIYDIPKADGYTSIEITKILVDLGYSCNVQINRHSNSKPFLSAMVKFDSEAHFHMALENHMTFKLRDNKEARILPFDDALSRRIKRKQVISDKLYDPNDFDYKILIQPEVTHLNINTKDDAQLPTPDNSSVSVNLFLKRIDKSWTTKDLYEIFKDYGEIKSAKVSLDPQTHQSKGYGFIWFKNPDSAAKVLEDSQNMGFPFDIEPYVPRLTKIQEQELNQTLNNEKFRANVLVVSNFDTYLSEDVLIDYISSFSEIVGYKFMKLADNQVSLLSFKNENAAQYVIDQAIQKPLTGQTLVIQQIKDCPLIQLHQQNIKNEKEQLAQNFQKMNLLVLELSNIPLSITIDELREDLSQYGVLNQCNFIKNSNKYQNKCHISFKDPEDAYKLIKMEQISIKDCKIFIKEHQFNYDSPQPQNEQVTTPKSNTYTKKSQKKDQYWQKQVCYPSSWSYLDKKHKDLQNSFKKIIPKKKQYSSRDYQDYEQEHESSQGYQSFHNNEETIQQKVERTQKQQLAKMTDADLKNLERQKEITEQIKQLHQRFYFGFYNEMYDECRSIIIACVDLLLEKNNDLNSLQNPEQFKDDILKRYAEVKAKNVKNWMKDFHSFSEFLDHLYVKAQFN
ncbi:poly a binding cytoplasmic 1 b [Stylonychia lemnae]|uniref:Poly a binding cytoplasmic 1 b n=1 Tax=Stylonychia lemnae TaxID=5949 RepID=A0A078B7A6_STYLE|nr:poly a binding cytoplasmic 1 b [Stylonychia lemnae]|eukprot:CDW89443.1 poly a binding cytoplasmic 1 b [Stylonychia lemnae]